MKSKVRNVGDIVFFDLDGKITIGAGDIQLRQLVEDTLAGGKNKIVINLKDVSHIDSSGIGLIIQARKLFKACVEIHHQDQ